MLKRVRLAAIAATIIAIFAIFTSSGSILGFQQATATFSRDLIHRYLAALYPGRASRHVGVVLLDDRSFRSFDAYPVKYSTHALYLRALLSFRPKNLFIDFTFLDDRPDPTLKDLLDVLEDYGREKIPVYLPAYRFENQSSGVRKEFGQLISQGVVRLISFELGRSLWGVPVYALHSQAGDQTTAATQIAFDSKPELKSLMGARREFEIWWGLPPHPVNCRFKGSECDPTTYSLFRRLVGTLQLKIPMLGVDLTTEDPVALPYTPFVFAQELMDGKMRAMFAPVLADRTVMYGPDMEIARDAYRNPVFAYRSKDERLLPGVFFHAMALENLLDLGPKVLAPRSDDASSNWWHDTKVILILSLALLVGRCFPWVENSHYRALEGAALVVLAVLIGIFEFLVLGAAPSNWVSAVALVSISSVARIDRGVEVAAKKLGNIMQKGRQK